ncbi:MAG: hypothetical protein U0797_11580 [Gemmataceae bacterium]
MRRRWRWARRGLVSLAVLFVVWGVATWWDRARTEAQGREELARVIAELDATDPRWRWEAIETDRPPVADAENSMGRIREASAAMVKWTPLEVMLPNGDDVLLEERPTNRRLDAGRLAIVHRFLQKQRHSLALAVTLKDFPHGRATLQLMPDVLSTPLPHAEACQQVYQLLDMDTRRLLHEGKSIEARSRIRALFHTAAALRGEPMAISQLVRLAGRSRALRCIDQLLGAGEVTDQECRDLMSHLTPEGDEGPMVAALRGERAGYHFLFTNLEGGQVPLATFWQDPFRGDYQIRPALSSRLLAWYYAPRLTEDHAHCLQTFSAALAIAKRPSHEQLAAWDNLHQTMLATRKTAETNHQRFFSALLFPDRKVCVAELRDRAHTSCVRAALAAERFRLANKRWPKSLDELCPAFLPLVPHDPYTGDPLVFSEREDGVVIYSVGMDGTDDGGVYFSLTGQPDTDLGVRLWNPNRRGLDPLKIPTAE